MAMQPDDEICLCFHVTLRKVVNYCRIEKPPVASLISQCLSAGTGCGWCRPLLQKIHREVCNAPEPWWRQGDDAAEYHSPQRDADLTDLTPEQFAAGRRKYIADTGAKPPPSDEQP